MKKRDTCVIQSTSRYSFHLEKRDTRHSIYQQVLRLAAQNCKKASQRSLRFDHAKQCTGVGCRYAALCDHFSAIHKVAYLLQPETSIMPPTSSIDRVDSSAELRLRVNVALETMKKVAADRISASASTKPLSDLSLDTVPAQDLANNLPEISRSTSTATTDWWQFVTSKRSSTASSLTDSTTSTSDDDECFSLGCPVAMSLSYSGSMHGLDAVPLDTSTSLAFDGTIEDADEVVAMNDNHAHFGCLLVDKIASAARGVRNFYNGVIHYRPPVCRCGCGVETKGLPFL